MMLAEPTGWPEWIVRHVPAWFSGVILFAVLLFIAWLLAVFAAGPGMEITQ